jgi:hypothetical protein
MHALSGGSASAPLFFEAVHPRLYSCGVSPPILRQFTNLGAHFDPMTLGDNTILSPYSINLCTQCYSPANDCSWTRSRWMILAT